MVWGFYTPSTIGKYSPLSEFEVGEDGESKYALRLNTYFHALPEQKKEQVRHLMGDRSSYSRFIKSLLYSTPSHRYSKDGAYHKKGCKIEGWQLPKSLNITAPHSRYFKLGDFFGGSIRYVSADFKAILEDLEPDVHCFFPIEVNNPFDKDGEDRDFFILIIGQYLDTFDPGNSDPAYFEKSERLELYSSYSSKRDFGGLAMSSERMARAHLWSEWSEPEVSTIC